VVSCLTLMNCLHARTGQQDGSSFTACGLSIADEHARTLFAETLEAVSCPSCQQQIAQGVPKKKPALHPKAVVTQLMEQAINGRDAECLAMTTGGEFASRFGPGRVARLHELFQDWHADIDELIAESTTVVARYTAVCVDRFGLLAAPETRLERQQTVIFEVSEGRVTGARAVVDDFGIWDALQDRPAA
jgi:ketosteroid isomerase-like protein